MPDTYFDLLAAYGAVWALIVFFLVRLIRDQGRLAAELNRLRSQTSSSQPTASERVARVG